MRFYGTQMRSIQNIRKCQFLVSPKINYPYFTKSKLLFIGWAILYAPYKIYVVSYIQKSKQQILSVLLQGNSRQGGNCVGSIIW